VPLGLGVALQQPYNGKDNRGNCGPIPLGAKAAERQRPRSQGQNPYLGLVADTLIRRRSEVQVLAGQPVVRTRADTRQYGALSDAVRNPNGLAVDPGACSGCLDPRLVRHRREVKDLLHVAGELVEPGVRAQVEYAVDRVRFRAFERMAQLTRGKKEGRGAPRVKADP
jgi:hypothetical protein